MKRLLIICLFSLAGCGNCKQTPQPTWTVRLIRPDGEVQKVFIVHSNLKPKCRVHSGGQAELFSDSGNGSLRYESTGLVAPTGWLWDSEQAR